MVRVAAQEDDVPDTNDGTPSAVADKPGADASAEILADLGEALSHYGNPQPPMPGQSTEAKAEAPKVEAKPEPKAEEKQDDPAPEAEGTKAADQPKAPDFSDLPDSIRSTFEQLHKDGHLAAEAVDEVRKGYLRQSDYTKKRMADADARRKWEEEKAKDEELLQAARALVSDPRKLAAFNKAMEEGSEPDSIDLVTADPADAAKAVDARIDKRLSAKEQAAEAREKQGDAREAGIKAAVLEFYDTVKDRLTKQEIGAILAEQQAAYNAKGIDLREQGDPSDVVERVSLRVEAYLAKKEAAEAAAKLSKRQADAARSAKASSSPTTRATPQPDFDLRTPEGRMRKALADEGIEDWSQVRMGNRGPITPV